MKLHPNGTIEGTPEELVAYMSLKEKKPAVTGGSWPTRVTDKEITSIATGIKYPGQGTIYRSQQQSSAQDDVNDPVFAKEYVNNSMKAMSQTGEIITLTPEEVKRAVKGEPLEEMLRKRKDQVDIQLNK